LNEVVHSLRIVSVFVRVEFPGQLSKSFLYLRKGGSCVNSEQLVRDEAIKGLEIFNLDVRKKGGIPKGSDDSELDQEPLVKPGELVEALSLGDALGADLALATLGVSDDDHFSVERGLDDEFVGQRHQEGGQQGDVEEVVRIVVEIQLLAFLLLKVFVERRHLIKS